MLVAVGEGVGVDESQAAERVGVSLGEGQRNITAHRMAHHDALVDAGLVEDRLDGLGHEVHGVDIAEGVGEAMAG